MDKAQGQDFDLLDFDFNSLDVWEKIWNLGCPVWQNDFVDPYVDNIMYSGAAPPPSHATLSIRIKVWSA